MFSANENVQLRQWKKRVVAWVEKTISEDVLDMGVNVMVMQVACKAPGCVPIETAIIIVFPKSDVELIQGLSESKGGSYKTKILKPMNEVTEQDVLEALPPQFKGGLRTIEKLCIQARDVMFGQITQLFGGYNVDGTINTDEGSSDVEGRRLIAEYLRQSLAEYIQRGCIPPEWGQPFPPTPDNKSTGDDNDNNTHTSAEKETETPASTTTVTESKLSSSTTNTKNAFQGTGNIIIRRPVEQEKAAGEAHATNRGGPSGATTLTDTQTNPPSSSSTPSVSVNTSTRLRQQRAAERQISNALNGIGGGGGIGSSSTAILSQLASREHAPGVRRPGCPCCDPDNPSNVIDQMLLL